MGKTTSAARALLSATAVLTATGLALTACTSDDSDDAAQGSGDASTAAPATDVDPATLGLSVGDCVSDLGAAAGTVDENAADPDADSDADSDAASDAESEEGADAASATTTSAAATTAAKTTSAKSTTTTAAAETTDEAADGTTDGTTAPTDLDDTVPLSTTGVETISCDEPHVGEVYAQQDLDNQVLFPGARMPQFTAAVCTGEAFEDYIGYPFDSSIFDVITYAPSKESWAAGDRTVTCVVTDPAAGYIPGTLEGAGY